jgi:hypothetical protein
MSYHSLVHRKLLPLNRPPILGANTSSSKRSRVLENLSAESINLTKEEFDETIQLIEGLGVHGLRYNKAMESALWG